MTQALIQERTTTHGKHVPMQRMVEDEPFTYGPHLEPFLDMATPGEWKSAIPNERLRHIPGLPPLKSDIGAKDIGRDELRAACLATQAVPDRDLLWAILMWGRMRIDAARRLAKHEDAWSDLVGCFRGGEMTRSECYTACRDLTLERPGGGIGPAYFTKLIFFANPRHDGYIMDQWTSRSVNLLVSGPPVVLMRTKEHVDPRNTAEHYERFCQVVEDLSWKIRSCNGPVPLDPEDVELCLFSTGGPEPKRAPWRKYVLKHG